MKGFFLSLVLWSTSLLQVSLAQQARLVVEADTIELGEPLEIRIENGAFSSEQPTGNGPWEIFSQTETTIALLNFTTGLHRLPVFRYNKLNGAADTIGANQLIIVQLAATVQESESVRAIAVPVTIPSSWRDWAPQLAAICGVFLWAVIWLVATVKQYGPSHKKLPPPSPRAQAQDQLQLLNREDPPTTISLSQQVFRNYLASLGMEGARTIPPAELNRLLEASDLEKEPFGEIVSKIENLDGLRFSGEAVSGQDAQSFFRLVQQFIESQPQESSTFSAEYIAQYGQRASGFSRIVAGCLDLFPAWILISGLLMWPGFTASVSLTEAFSEPLLACLTGLAAAVLLRTAAAWMTISGTWKATPGMRLMTLAVAGKSKHEALRPLLWLLASLPLWMGHLGIFSRSGISIVDSFMGQQVRKYPRQSGKE